MKKLILVLLAAGWVSTLAAQDKYEGIAFMENEPWETVLEKARTENRLIFVDCYTTWCGPCKGLSEKVFPQKKVGDFFNANFVNAKYDMEKGDGLMLHKKYKEHIPGFPSLLLIDSDGEVVHKLAGYMEADVLIDRMKAGLEGNTLFAIQDRYEAGARDFETIAAYINALDAAVVEDRKKEVIAEYIGSITDFKELEKPEVWSIVGSSIRDPYSEVFGYVVENIDRGLPIRAKTDRYKLESQLGSAISNEIRDMLKLMKSTDDADTLRVIRENQAFLKGMLVKNGVKRFPDYLAKLEMNDLLYANNPAELFRQLAIIRKTGLLAQESYFLVDCYAYIIDNVKDKKLIAAATEEVVGLQGPPRENPSPMSSNFHNVIARGYTKLGDKAKAAEAQAAYDKQKALSDTYIEKMRKELGI